MEHSFTKKIYDILNDFFGDIHKEIFKKSELLQYLNYKTKSANKGSKSRGSFANLYAIYVLVEDYINKGFVEEGDYSKYEGAEYTKLFTRQRELPFGEKLQNHALNNRMNAEFKKFFPATEFVPIIRDLKTNKYWIHQGLLSIQIDNERVNVSEAVIAVIDAYTTTKQNAFNEFVEKCETLKNIESENAQTVQDFIISLIQPNVDARLFEIVSYSILKVSYSDIEIIWGYSEDKLIRENLKLYKTGRTNANDGGIDFVMKPLGRFFQVTETLDFKKYFLDIDKIEKYPISFVVKSDESIENLTAKIKENALKTYGVAAVVESYMSCIEELINNATLIEHFEKIIEQGKTTQVLEEIIIQSKLEFNALDDDER